MSQRSQFPEWLLCRHPNDNVSVARTVFRGMTVRMTRPNHNAQTLPEPLSFVDANRINTIARKCKAKYPTSQHT